MQHPRDLSYHRKWRLHGRPGKRQRCQLCGANRGWTQACELQLKLQMRPNSMTIDDVGRCRASMMRAAMFGLCLCGSLPAFAASLGEIATALAAPAGTPQATNDWTAFAKLAGAKWQGKAPAKGGNKYYWNGRCRSPPWARARSVSSAVRKRWTGHGRLAEGHRAREGAGDARRAVPEGHQARTGSRRLPGRAAEWLTHLSRDAGRSQAAPPAHPVRARGTGRPTSTIEMEPLRNEGWIC